MIVVLRCNRHVNEHVCRRELRHEAYVTTCSHIFCRECVQEQHFIDPAGGRRQCLACDTILATVDDVVRTNLRPKEEHLGTLLSGLEPATIMDCANKALTFWNYQISTEIAWQEHLVQRWMGKYTGLRSNASKVIEEANGEIANLQQQVNTLTREKEGMQRHASDLAVKLDEKTAAQEKLQILYNTIKFKVQNEHSKSAAAASTDHTAQHIDVARSNQSFNEPQFDTASLPPLRTSKKAQGHYRYPVDEHGVELLHPYQRSGSARGQTSSEIAAAAQAMMPPPLRSNGKESHYRTGAVASPAQRVTLSRTDKNYTFPQASVNRQSVSQHFPNQSIDRNVTQNRVRYHSQFQPASASHAANPSGRIAANRNLY